METMAKKQLFSFLQDQLSTVPSVANVDIKAKTEAAIQREGVSFYYGSLNNILALPTNLEEATGYPNSELRIVDLNFRL